MPNYIHTKSATGLLTKIPQFAAGLGKFGGKLLGSAAKTVGSGAATATKALGSGLSTAAKSVQPLVTRAAPFAMGSVGLNALASGTNQAIQARTAILGAKDHSTGFMDGATEGVAQFLHGLDQMNPLQRGGFLLKGSDILNTDAGQKGLADFVARQQDPTLRANMPAMFERVRQRLADIRANGGGLPRDGMFAPGSTADQYGASLRNMVETLMANKTPAA